MVKQMYPNSLMSIFGNILQVKNPVITTETRIHKNSYNHCKSVILALIIIAKDRQFSKSFRNNFC
jgi:hypothetical protein